MGRNTHESREAVLYGVIVVACITGVVTLVGVILSNSKSRAIMEVKLVARAAKKRRRHNSYEGEITEAPENLLHDERGKHHFRTDEPNEPWITDVTEFRVPAGRACLLPIVDCFDGMPPSWSVSTSPDAEMADSSLLGACKWLGEGDHPTVHSDRGCHYRWPWMDKDMRRERPGQVDAEEGVQPRQREVRGLLREVEDRVLPRLRLGRVTIEEFGDMLDAYLRWYRGVRIKGDLDYRSPMQHRRDLGLAA